MTNNKINLDFSSFYVPALFLSPFADFHFNYKSAYAIVGKMSSLKWVASLISLVFLIFVCEAEQKLSTKECENLGFTGLALCSDCHTFAEYIKDQGEFYFYLQSIRLDFDEILFLYRFNFCVESLFSLPF